jgi:hypothetical protein
MTNSYREVFKSVVPFTLAVMVLWMPAINHRILEAFEVADSKSMMNVALGVIMNEPFGTVGSLTKSTFIFLLCTATVSLGINLWLLPIIASYTFVALSYMTLMVFVGSFMKVKNEKLFGKGANVALTIVTHDVFVLLYSSDIDHQSVGGLTFYQKGVVYRMFLYLFGGSMSYLCGVFLFPRWAGDELRKEIKHSIRSLGDLLGLITDVIVTVKEQEPHNITLEVPKRKRNFFERLWATIRPETDMNPLTTIQKLQCSIESTKRTFSKIAVLLEESKMEISYSYFDPSYYEFYTMNIQRLLRQLICISSSCERIVQELGKYHSQF